MNSEKIISSDRLEITLSYMAENVFSLAASFLHQYCLKEIDLFVKTMNAFLGLIIINVLAPKQIKKVIYHDQFVRSFVMSIHA